MQPGPPDLAGSRATGAPLAGDPSPTTVPGYVVFLVAAAPFLVVVLWRWTWVPYASMGDYAQYLLHARALLDGRDYADIGFVWHPEAGDIGPRAYPPGLPLLLVPFLAAGLAQQEVMRLLMVGLALGFGWFAWLRLARDVSREAAALGVGVALLAIEVTGGTMAPTSDLLFAFILWALILVADTPGPWSMARTIAIVLLGFALVSVRLVGVAIGPALLAFAVLHRRRHGVRPFLVLAAWGLAAVTAFAVMGNPYEAGVVDADLMSPARKLFFFMQAYRYALFEAVLYPFGLKVADQAYHILASLAVLAGTVVIVRRAGTSLLVSFAASYLVLLLVVRQAAARFVLPLQPIVGAALVLGLAQGLALLARGRPRLTARLPVLFVGSVVALAAGRALTEAHPFTITGTPDATAMYAFLRAEGARRPARLMFSNPRVLTLQAGIPAMGVLDRSTPGQMVAIDAMHVTHVVTLSDARSDCLQQVLNAVPERYPGRFDLVFGNATFRVYRVRPAAQPFVAPYDIIDWQRPPADCRTT